MKPEYILKDIDLDKFVPFKLDNNLLLGVATASTQIEGDDKNSNWALFCQKGKIKDKTSSLRGNQSYKFYVRDIDLMESLNIQSYRFSIDWAKLNPKENYFDEEVMQHYIAQIQILKKNNILPFVTLHHFSHPIWFEEKKGFLKKKNIIYFIKYVKYITTKLKGLVSDYCTINEPNVYAVNSFFFGIWLNEEKSLIKTIKVMKNMSLAHRLAYKAIKEIDSNANVGFAMHIQDFVSKDNKLINKIETKIFDKCFNNACLFAMSGKRFVFPFGVLSIKKKSYMDYLGINFYTQNEVSNFSYSPNKKYYQNDLGWAIVPSSFKKALIKYYNKFKKDIYVTENGTADKEDKFRKEFIYSHLYAIKDLKFVKRYYHWTLMDNFEWLEGESAKFGLVQYDYENNLCHIRTSGYLYKEIIEKHSVDNKMIDKYFKN